MNVKELVAALSRYPQEAFVYVPDHDGTVQIAKQVQGMPHIGLPEGIAIPDDVIVLPQSMVDDGDEHEAEDT